MEANREAYSHLDSDTKELLEVVAKVKIKEEQGMEKEEKKYDLCKAFVDMKLEGIEEGKAEGKREYLVRTVCIKIQKNKSAEVIADELEEELAEVERIIEVQKRVGSYDVERICMMMTKE